MQLLLNTENEPCRNAINCEGSLPLLFGVVVGPGIQFVPLAPFPHDKVPMNVNLEINKSGVQTENEG